MLVPDTPSASEPGFTVLRDNAGSPDGLRVFAWSRDLEQALANPSIKGLVVDETFGGSPSSLRLLPHFAPQLEYLAVGAKPRLELEFISELTHLRSVSLGQPTDAVSFSGLSSLATCTLTRGATVGRLSTAPALETLYLEGVVIRSCEVLHGLGGVRRLTIRRTPIERLDGIETLSIRSLSLHDNRQLESVAALSAMPCLEELAWQNCRAVRDVAALAGLRSLQKIMILSGPALAGFELVAGSPGLRVFRISSTNMSSATCSIAPFTSMSRLESFHLYAGPTKGFACIRDLERLGEIPSLETLTIDRGPEVRSIGFLRGLKGLRYLRFTRTRIADGDLAPILELHNLEHLDFGPARKHYSHTEASLEAEWLRLHPGRPLERGVALPSPRRTTHGSG